MWWMRQFVLPHLRKHVPRGESAAVDLHADFGHLASTVDALLDDVEGVDVLLHDADLHLLERNVDRDVADAEVTRQGPEVVDRRFGGRGQTVKDLQVEGVIIRSIREWRLRDRRNPRIQFVEARRKILNVLPPVDPARKTGRRGV